MNENMFQGMSYRSTEINPQKMTLVFIHGLSGSLSAWYPFEGRLSKDFNLVTMDIRGHGKSLHPDAFEGYDPKASADDIYKLLAHLGARRVVIVSHSFGTIVALELLRAHPAVAIGSIFISAVYGFRKGRFASALTEGGSILTALFSHLHMRVEGSRTDYARFTPASDWDMRRVAADVRHTGLRSYIYSFRHISMRDRDAEWKQVKVPTLLIHGTKDSYVPIRFAEELQSVVPHSTLLKIEGGNHILPLNNVDTIESGIRTFTHSLSV